MPLGGFEYTRSSPRADDAEPSGAIACAPRCADSYRLCKLPTGSSSDVSEECFQRTPLEFASDTQWLQYDNETYQYDKMVKLPRFALPLRKTNVGTHPAGSWWARVPVPGCRLCDQSVCGAGLMPNMTQKTHVPEEGNFTYYGGLPWFHQQQCAQSCAGLNLTACPPGLTQFAEPLPGISGYTGTYPPIGHNGLPYSIVDVVKVPSDLEPGEYLLSWRWDCEQSHQIWQNCADVRIVVDESVEEA
uniref:Chitin-binding type-4 domain-containing protein n=1 Tax=Prymnesium polylepis TaxID=72548 RepID=A0A6V4EJH4_9EUKA|mmetsp:Transcript_23877/g.64029  ORF Transcript_23877/g.64029 Transcript_23877/m.64029 type:complete len:245 (+) Transcript_23877:558-1292(+)